jgi:hypothetical protein
VSVLVVNLVTNAADVQAGRPGVGLLTEQPGAGRLLCERDDLKKRLGCGAFACWRWRAGAGDHVA